MNTIHLDKSNVENYIHRDLNTLFKSKFSINEPFIREDTITKNIKFNYNENIDYKLTSIATFLDRITLDINIENIEMKKQNRISDTNISETKFVTTILYNNFNTFLFKISSNLYLIPEYLLDITNFEYDKLQFIEIKDFFNTNINNYISNYENIFFAKIKQTYLNNELIDLLHSYSNIIDKNYLTYILSSSNVIFSKNLLSKSNYNNYVKKIKDDLFFFNYQYNNQIDKNVKFYEIFDNNQNEISYYYYLKNILPNLDNIDDSILLDINYNYTYFISNNISLDNLEKSIVEMPYILFFILKNFYSDINYKFTIFKNFELNENKINSNINNTNFFINTEWNNNFNLHLNIKDSLENTLSPLFTNFKIDYNNVKINLSNNFTNNKIKDPINLWKKLFTIQNRFLKIIGVNSTNINYTNYNNFINELNIIETKYESLTTLESVDSSLVFVLLVTELLNSIVNEEIYYDTSFIKLFCNKIVNFLYLKFYRNERSTDQNLLKIYFNLELDNIITSNILSEELEKLYYKNSFISVIPTESILNSLDLVKQQFSSVNSTNGLSSTSLLDCYEEFVIKTEYIITNFEIEDQYVKFNKNEVNFKNGKYFIKNSNINIEESFINNSFLYIRTNNNSQLNSPFTIIEKNTIKTPIVKSLAVGNQSESKRYILNDNNINLFITNNILQVNITNYSSTDTYYLNYIKNGINNRIKIELETNHNNYNIKSSNLLNNNNYDTIYLEQYKLPITNITINDSNCYDINTETVGTSGLLELYYPKIYLAKDTLNEDVIEKITNINTFRIGNNKVKLVNTTDIYFELKVFDNNSFSENSLILSIFDNSYLPNFLTFTSFNNNGDIMDYFIQQPFITQLNTENSLPIYLFQNFPKYNNTTKYLYNNKVIDIIYNTDSNQILRDTVLYSTHYDQNNQKNNNTNITALTNIKNILDNIKNQTIYSDIIKIIDKSQEDLLDLYYNYFKKIKNNFYGSTVNKVLSNLYKIDNNFNINCFQFDFNEYTNFSIGLETFNNLDFDTKLQTSTIEEDTNININYLRNQFIFNSPYLRYSTKFNLSNNVLDFLKTFSNKQEEQLEYIKNRNKYNNFIDSQLDNNRYDTLDEYYTENNLNYLNQDTKNIVLLNPSKYTNKINDNEVLVYYNNNKINTNNNLTTNDNIKLIPQKNTSIIYKDEINSFNQNSIKKYNLIGAVKVLNNRILFNDVSNKILEDITYITDDNMNIYSQNNFNEFKGINLNSKKLQITSSNDILVNKINKKLFGLKIKISLNLESNKNYYINLKQNNRNIFGILKYSNTNLSIISTEYINITNKINLTISKTNDSLPIIISNLEKNKIIPTLTSLTLENFKLISTTFINFYSSSLNNNFFFTKDGSILDYKYNSFITFNDYKLFFINNLSNLNITVKYFTPVDLPPVFYDNGISVYNSIKKINWINNINHWIKIGTHEFQIKDKNNQNITNGNYLLYYCPNENRPNNFKNNTFIDSISNLNGNTLVFNPYDNKIITNNDISETLDNYYFELNDESYEIKQINSREIQLENEKYKETFVIVKNQDSKIFYRPLVLTNSSRTYNYSFKTDNINTDSFFVLRQNLLYYFNLSFDNFTTLEFNDNFDFIVKSNNSNISLTKVSKNKYNLSILNSSVLVTDIIYKNIITVEYNGIIEEIIFWFIYSDLYDDFTLSYNNNMLKEPLYIDFNSPRQLKINNDNVILYYYAQLNSTYEFMSFENKYFSRVGNNLLSKTTNNLITNYKFKSNTIKYFDDIETNINGINNIEKINIFNCDKLKFWKYQGIVNITNNSIILDNNNNVKFFIFYKNNNFYFNELKTINNDRIYFNLDHNLEGNTHMYILNFDTLFIKNKISFYSEDKQIFLKGNFIENQIVGINNSIIHIIKYNPFRQYYEGKIINNVTNNNNFALGYYDYGLVSSFRLRKNVLCRDILYHNFKNIDYNDLKYGDYFIENNNLQIYSPNLSISTNIFRKSEGSSFKIFYDNTEDKYYFDTEEINLNKYDIINIFYNNNNYVMRINEISNDNITFYSNFNFDLLEITNNLLFDCYYPFQQFEVKSLNIENNYITEIKNGWIEILNSSWQIYKVTEGIINISNNTLNGIFTCRIINPDIFLFNDFRNNIKLQDNNTENSNVTNSEIIWEIESMLKLDNNEIYFEYDNIDLEYSYHNKIWINNKVYKLKKYTNSRVYLNISSSELNLNTNYRIILSNSKINNFTLKSNNMLLDNKSIINYPKITNGSYDLLIIKLIGDKYIMNNIPIVISGNNLNLTIDNYNENYYYFINDFIPITISYSAINDNFSFQVKNLSIDNNQYYLLEEVDKSSNKYLHFIKLDFLRNFLVINNKIDYFDKEGSKFYLNRVIPINVIDDIIHINFPILRNNQYKNNFKNMLDYYVKIPIQITGPPIKSNKFWKFKINLSESNFNIINEEKLFLDDTFTDDSTYIQKINNLYFIFLKNYPTTKIEYVYVKKINIIKKVNKTSYEFNNILKSINDFKVSKLDDNLFGSEENLKITYTNRFKLKNINLSTYTIESNDLRFNLGYKFIFPYQNINSLTDIGNNQYKVHLDNEIFNISVDKFYNFYLEKNQYTDFIEEDQFVTLDDIYNVLSEIDISKNIFNKLKPWNIWSLYFQSEETFPFLKKGSLLYYNNVFSIEHNDSYYLDEEIDNLKAVIKYINENNDYETVLNELHLIETDLFTSIKNIYNESYFFNDLENIIDEIILDYKQGTNKWIVYKNCLMTYNNNILEFETNPERFTISNNIIKRKYYVGKEFEIINYYDSILIYRSTNVVLNEISNILSDSNISNYGFSFDELNIFLINIKNDILSIDKNVTYNYEINNSIKYIITNIWNKINSHENFKRINKNFNSKLDIIPNNIKDFGVYYNKLFENIFYDFNHTINNSFIYQINKSFSLDYNNLYAYKIFVDNYSFSTNVNYIIDILKGDNKLKDPYITKYVLEDNNVIFYSNVLINNDISIGIEKDYEISGIKNNGKIYNINLEYSIPTTANIIIYYNDIEVKILDNSNSLQKQISLNDTIINDSFIKLSQKHNIIKIEKLLNRTNIYLNPNFVSYYNENIDIYLENDNILYPILFSNNIYYIEGVVDLQTFKLYEIVKFINITSFEDLNKYNFDITISTNLESNMNQTDNLLPNSFTIENYTLDNIIILKPNKINMNSNSIISNVSKLKHNYKLEETEDFIVKSLTNQNKYLYKIVGKFNLKNNYILGLNRNNSIINLNYRSHNDNELNFFTETFYTLDTLNTYNFLIKYVYEIISFTINGNIIIANINSNFDLNYNDYTYKLYVNGSETDFTFDINNNKFLFTTTNNLENVNTIVLHQTKIYDLTGNEYKITRNQNNAIFRLETFKNLNIIKNDIPILRYINNNTEFSDNIYRFTYTNSNTINFGDFVYINYDGYSVKVKVIDIYNSSNIYTFKIDTCIELDLSKAYTFSSFDLLYSSSIDLFSDNNIYGKGMIENIISLNVIDIVLDNNSFSNYLDNNIYGTMVTSFQKKKINLENISYNNPYFTKLPNTITNSNSITEEIIQGEFIDELPFNLFKNIELHLNDSVIEKLDYNTYQIFLNYYLDKEKRESFKKLVKPEKTKNGLSIKLPLIFFFYDENSLLPLNSLNKSSLFIKFKTNKIESILKNYNKNYVISKKPVIKTSIMQSNIYLNKEEEKEIYKNQNFYLIKTFNLSNKNIIKPGNNLIKNQITGIVKDIFWKINYDNIDTIKKDYWQISFDLKKEKYQNYIDTNNFNIEDIDDIIFLIDINEEIKNGVSDRYKTISMNKILKNYSTEFLLYLDSKFLRHINSDWTLPLSQKVSSLIIYLNSIYKYDKVNSKNKTLENIDISLNGIRLSDERSLDYYNYVVPYKYGFNLDECFYNMSFSTTNNNIQPTGHMNFSKIGQIEFNLNNKNDPLEMNVITTDYKMLKVKEGIGGII